MGPRYLGSAFALPIRKLGNRRSIQLSYGRYEFPSHGEVPHLSRKELQAEQACLPTPRCSIISPRVLPHQIRLYDLTLRAFCAVDVVIGVMGGRGPRLARNDNRAAQP